MTTDPAYTDDGRLLIACAVPAYMESTIERLAVALQGDQDAVVDQALMEGLCVLAARYLRDKA